MSMEDNFFKHRTHIKLNFPNGNYARRPLMSDLRGFNIKSFEFVNADNYRVTENFMRWFMDEVVPQASRDPFLFKVSMSTAPQDLQDYIKQLQGTN